MRDIPHAERGTVRGLKRKMLKNDDIKELMSEEAGNVKGRKLVEQAWECERLIVR